MQHKRKFYAKLLIISLPMIIQNFLTFFVNFLDNFMIGLVGEAEIAALGVVGQFYMIFMLFMFGIHNGCSIFISQYFGVDDFSSIKKVIGVSLLSSFIVSIIFILLTLFGVNYLSMMFNADEVISLLIKKYLFLVLPTFLILAISQAFGAAARSIGESYIPMIGGVVAFIVNIFFNYLLIFGKLGFPKLGIGGAAIATVIARSLELLVILALVYGKDIFMNATLKNLFSFNFSYYKKIFLSIIPVVFNELTWGLGVVVYGIIYSAINIQAFTSVQISATIINLLLVALFGVGQASAVIIGNEAGANNFKLAYSYSKRMLGIGLIISIFIAIILVALIPVILSYYSVSADVYNWTYKILSITAFIIPIRCINIMLLTGFFRGGGDIKFSFFTEASTVWLVGVPLTAIAAYFFKWDIVHIYAISMVEELTKFTICSIRYKSKKWMRNLVSTPLSK